jgi:hypothetical protein
MKTRQIRHWRRISKAHDLRKYSRRKKQLNQKKKKVPTDKNWWYLK